MTPLVITGLGAVAQGLVGRAAFEGATREREVGQFRAPTLFDESKWPGARVLEATDFDPAPVLGDKGLRNLDRLTRFFLVAARNALEDAGLKREGKWTEGADGRRAGVCASTAYGSLESMVELHRVALLESPRYLNPAKFPNTVINAALGYVSIWEDLRAVNATVCNGNCGALDSVLVAETFLSTDRADVIVIGGAEAMHEALYLAFERLEAMATEGQPFAPGDPDRSRGMRLGEGAVLLTVEREESARARGASCNVRITGFGTSFEPPPSEVMIINLSAEAIERAVRLALADANIAASDIDAVVSASNGYAAYDRAEQSALAKIFDAPRPRALAKRAFGETLGAGGAFALGTAYVALDKQIAPAAHDSAAWPTDAKRLLVLSTGFYGNATAVVVERAR
jgi:3-oxoacyl-[acyl-carrier-protein] synthase II